MVPLSLTLVLSILFAIPLHSVSIVGFYCTWALPAREKICRAFAHLQHYFILFRYRFAYFCCPAFRLCFFTATGPTGIALHARHHQSIGFYFNGVFAFGVAFEIPIATYLLVLTGFTTVDSLVEKRPYIFGRASLLVCWSHARCFHKPF